MLVTRDGSLYKAILPGYNSGESVAGKQRNVSAAVRVAEFGKDIFFVDDGKLFCRACNEVVDHIRKNTVERHLKRQKHVIKVAQLGPKAENRSDWLQTIRSVMSFRTDAEYARKELAVDLSEALIAANVPIEKVTP